MTYIITRTPLRTIILPVLCIGLASLTGCSSLGLSEEEETSLPGERISVLELQSELEPDDVKLEGEGFVAPDPWQNDYWPQAMGYPNHAMQNLAFSDGAPEQQWQADIGAGASAAVPLMAQPVVFDNRIYTIDANSVVRAFGRENGERIWSRSLRPDSEDEGVIPGGLSYSGGRLFATSGYNQALALDPETGEVDWRVQLPSAARSAPSVLDGRVYIVTLDNRLIALDAANGEILWRHQGLSETSGVIGTASPAVNQDIVVPVYSSGQVFALRVENGSVAWSDNLGTLQGPGGLEALADISAFPVIDKNIVIAASYGGRIVAIDERTGRRVWQREIGTDQTPWVAGNHIFVVSKNNELAAMGRDNGVIRWVYDLPRFENAGSRTDPVTWAGPVLAGGRLILLSSTGRMIEIDPADGEVVRNRDIGGNLIIPPVIAGRTMYVLGQDGTLRAFR